VFGDGPDGGLESSPSLVLEALERLPWIYGVLGQRVILCLVWVIFPPSWIIKGRLAY
jgi:hypothetical protein